MLKIIQISKLKKTDYDFIKDNFDCTDNDYIKIEVKKSRTNIEIIKAGDE